jgi:hypothetical protein
LLNFRAFYRAFPDSADASAESTWSHFDRLLSAAVAEVLRQADVLESDYEED